MTQGQDAENIALNYLQQQGLTLVARNVRYKVGEIDLIMLHLDVLVFVEVKFRSTTPFGGALHALSTAQINRIRKAASLYIQAQHINTPCRFDLIAIDGKNIQWLKDAF